MMMPYAFATPHRDTSIQVHVVQEAQNPTSCELIITVSALASDAFSSSALVSDLLARYVVLEKTKAKGLKTSEAPSVAVMPQLDAIESNYPWAERGAPFVPLFPNLHPP
jgi:hypothetical protein